MKEDKSSSNGSSPQLYLRHDLSIIIVTSPTPSMPSTDLLDACIHSFDNIAGLESCPIIIVMDGFKVSDSNRTKRGKITVEFAAQYDLYHNVIKETFSSSRFRVVRADQHLGFAFAVKYGLELCTTKFALIAQHDRIFYNYSTRSSTSESARLRPLKQKHQIENQLKFSKKYDRDQFVDRQQQQQYECEGCLYEPNRADSEAIEKFLHLEELLQAMECDDSIRYIGFPTSSSIRHDKLLASNCNLNILNKPAVKKQLGSNLYLQPLIFWFDSQHICNVSRYLEIYQPYKHMPEDLKRAVGLLQLRDMLLRPGDFIEDRLGQAQRRMLVAFAAQAATAQATAVHGRSSTVREAVDDIEGCTIEADSYITATNSILNIRNERMNACSPTDSTDAETTVEAATVSVSLPSPPSSHSPSLPFVESAIEEAKATPVTDALLSVEAAPPITEELIVRLFRWFGTYLCWPSTCDHPYEVQCSNQRSESHVAVMVGHLKGRQLTTERIQLKLRDFHTQGHFLVDTATDVTVTADCTSDAVIVAAVDVASTENDM